MLLYFLDTNALIGAYSNDPAYAWVRGLVNKRSAAPGVILSDLTHIEFHSAVYSLERERLANPGWVRWTIPAFERHIRISREGLAGARYRLIELTPDIIERARDLVKKYQSGKPKALHTLDAIQLACAIKARSMLPDAQRPDVKLVTED
ncbi:MAG: type II toxin-antitoxin system VapC family toxin, partial [Ktedonobacterales bacterium]